MINRLLRVLHRLCQLGGLAGLLAAAAPVSAQTVQPLARRLDRLLDQPPFDRATWGVVVADTTGKILYERNGNRLFIPASNTKLLVAGVASAMLGPDYRVTTSVYGGGPLTDGVLQGDLIVYGRGNPTFSTHCYSTDTLAIGGCDSVWTGLEALADSLVQRGVQHVAGALVGDGSYFEPQLIHDAWEQYDLNWWYAAPVSALGFNDNSVDVSWKPGPRLGAPATVSFTPEIGFFLFENRSRTTPVGTPRNIDFFRQPGTMLIWAEGNVPLNNPGRTEYFALPDPNLYFAHAFRAALEKKGISVAGSTVSTTDSLRYREAREAPALVSMRSRPLADILFPILNTSQNWFAEMMLKLLGREKGAGGSWTDGLQVERQFLVDSVHVDSTAFAVVDASGLAKNNLVAPRAFTQLLAFLKNHPNNAGFMRGLPRSGQRGSLKDRFKGTPIEGRVMAKTGTVSRVNALSGYVERPKGGTLVFSVIANNHTVGSRAILAQIDSIVVEMAR